MTNYKLAELLSCGHINVIKNKIPKISLNKIISEIKNNYNGLVDYNCNILTINDIVVEIEGHEFEWYGDKILKMK